MLNCKICGGILTTRLSQTEIIVEGKSIQVTNLPAFYCKRCNREFFHELVLKKAEAYASACNCSQLDYRAFEENEGEDMLSHGLL